MNILELDNYSLDDAVKFHNRLNPRLWGSNERLKPEVASKLLAIAADFQEFLGVEDLDVVDITVSGSNAAFSYTPHSDIDLHLVIKMPEENRDIYQELFNAKKYQYNDEHDIKIRNADVELYAQPSDENPKSQGIYSLKHNKWIQVPKRRKAEIDDSCVKSKVEDLDARIHSAVESGDTAHMQNLWAKIKDMRKTGLETNGEFGCENLAFKILRTKGCLKELKLALNAARDQELGMTEQYSQPVIYGFREDVGSTPDGVSASTRMFLSEVGDDEKSKIVQDFIKDTAEWLGIENLPEIHIFSDPEWSTKEGTFGRYLPHEHQLEVNIANRHIMDTLRTVAHELAHCKQHEVDPMPDDAGDTGSPWENEANAIAGIIMRHFANTNPGLFENASGYIPTAREKNDPRYSMALTVDIKPGQVGKEANKLALKTNKQGKPGLLIKSANMIGEALDKPEMTVPELAKKHRVSVDKIKKQLAKGIRVEKEHTTSDATAREIALDHIAEFPDYYDRLEKVETREGLELAIAREFKLFEQDLFEVKMTSKNLAKLAKDIPGVKVGLEFEMIVPNASVSGDDDTEPDYDQDQRVRDIDDAVNFFDDGDFNGRNELRRLREAMESDFFDWQIGQMDEAWHNNGFEFFQEYLDREEPFDPTDYQDQAEDDVKSEHPELDPTSEEFEQLVSEKLNEINATYYVDQWEEQGRNYDYAREEFDDEQRDNFSESDWLDAEGIRYASDVESNYGHVTWPYYTSSSGDDEADIERVALDFMNGIGADTVAYSSNYHGSYKKWTGDGWVLVGSEKPDDCFSIEPDGSLHGDDSDDVGLEFVSPPIPLEDIGTVMQRVQKWAGEYGVYTGKSNGTSIHTNISVPGYDLDKLDYLKAALLLGDEHVLREFDRVGNTYAAPAIAKVKELVKQKPEKAKELLDKMKSQLNAEASKLIHSGQTNKFTSINTKGNRVEFRSPGGDYLSIIADNPQKMIDTINRMVVTLDAAMDPNKYKEEYQKKLYKVLTGQAGGREARTGAKQEMKKDDKDLLNIFSRYAAGELPKQALKSFVRQAQLERKVKREKDANVKMWWNVARDGQRIEVVATNEMDAKLTAAKEWGIVASDSNLNSMTVKPLRPYDDTAGGPQVVAQQPTTPAWGVWDGQRGGFISSRGGIGPEGGRLIGGDTEEAALAALSRNGLDSRYDHGEVEVQQIPQRQPAIPGSNIYRITDTRGGLIAGDEYDNDQAALERAAYWAQRRGVDVVVRNARGEEVGRVSSSSEITPAGQQRPAASTDQGNWGIWIQNADRFANQPGEYPRGATPPLYRFPSREAAEQWIEQQRAARPNMRTDIEVREIEPAQALPDIFPDLPRQQAAGEPSSYELYRISDGRTVTAPAGNPIVFRATDPEDAESKIARYAADFNLGAPELFAVRSVLNVPAPQYSTQFGAARGAPNWELVRDRDQVVVHRIFADNQDAAIGQAADFTRMQGWDPNQYTLQAAENTDAAQGGIVDVADEQPAADNWSADFERRMQGGGNNPEWENPQPAPTFGGSFTGEWKVVDPNGNEIYRFGGVGNSQSDANRVAIQWLQRNPRHMQGGVEVLPVMA